jgi:hypothetical protein
MLALHNLSWLLRPTAYYRERGLVPSRYCEVGVPKFYPITIVEFFVGRTRVYQFSSPIFNIRPSSRAHSHDDRMPLRSRLVPSLLGVSRRQQLVLSGLPYSVDLHDEGFAVVDIWRQSSYFPPLKLLRCSFNTDVALAAMEMRCMLNFIHSLRTMEHVHSKT